LADLGSFHFGKYLLLVRPGQLELLALLGQVELELLELPAQPESTGPLGPLALVLLEQLG
jgi:hypothetical protein